VGHEIFAENLGMHHVAGKFVPQLLSEDKKKFVLVSVKSLLTMQMVMKIL